MNAVVKVKTRLMHQGMAARVKSDGWPCLDFLSTARIVSSTSPCEPVRMSIKKVTRTAENRPAYTSLARFHCLRKGSTDSQKLEQNRGLCPQVWLHGPMSPFAP